MEMYKNNPVLIPPSATNSFLQQQQQQQQQLQREKEQQQKMPYQQQQIQPLNGEASNANTALIPYNDNKTDINSNEINNNKSYNNNNENNNNKAALVNEAYQILINNLNSGELKNIKENLEKTIEVLSEDCALSHLVTQLAPNNIFFDVSNMIWGVFDNHFRRKLQDRYERIFESFCSPCTFVKLGLFFENIQKPLPATACIMNPSRSGETNYNLGPFIHGEATFRIDKRKHPDIHNYSETISFPPGVVIIPDSKIITQITDMDINKICMGVKICMINSDERNVTNGTVMTRFLARNPNLDCGYYSRDKTIDMKEYNKKMSLKSGSSSSSSNHVNILTLNKILEKFFDDYNYKQQQKNHRNNNTNKKSRVCGTNENHSKSTIVNQLYIDEVDNEDAFNENNIFQNGEPLKYVRPEDDPCKPEDIGMRVFDINPVLISYMQNMTNIQASVERAHMERIEKQYTMTKGGGIKFIDKDTHFLSDNRLIHHTNYDFLCLAFFNELNQEKLNSLPPFNGKCILKHSNILFINKNGESIMIDDDPDYTACTIYNNLLKLMDESSIQNKFISTASNTNLTFNGKVPKAKFTVEAINDLFQAMIKADTQKDIPQQDKKLYEDFVEQNSSIFRDVHNKIKNSADIFKNYFCEFNDDLNEKVEFKDNEVAFDTARKIYPEIVLDSGRNKRHVTLDFSVKSNERPIVDSMTPNVAYVKNLGFVSLTNICNGAPLILKNTSVLLQNLKNRYTKKKNAIISTVGGCKRARGTGFDSDDDFDEFSMPKAQIVVTMPEKTKILPGTINLYGEESDFDHMGHIRRLECNKPRIQDMIGKYAGIDSSVPCLRGV